MLGASSFRGVTGALGAWQRIKSTLERLVDFDRINDAREMRLSVGAVNVQTGRFAYFDSENITIRPEHVMASGALPPGFPPIEIDGEFYWDGGLVSNTPLQYVLDYFPRRSRLCFQVDVFQAFGPLPANLEEISEREKDIRYSSRTRVGTQIFMSVIRFATSSTNFMNYCRKRLRRFRRHSNFMNTPASPAWILRSSSTDRWNPKARRRIMTSTAA